MIRISKILAQAGIASRRKAEALIASGRVSLNGRIVTAQGTQADPARDELRVDGRPIQPAKPHHYFAYYKPRGLLVTKSDELGRKGIFQTLRLPPQVNSVGRLDKDSEGLLLLSDDGAFIQEYTHPSFEIPKVYRVQISRPLNREEGKRLIKGIPLREKTVRVRWVRPLKKTPGHWVTLELREGVKREIRRMLEALGIRVLRLIRIQHGSVRLGSLKPGGLMRLKNRPK